MISKIWASKSSWKGKFILNDKNVSYISSRLEPGEDIGEPFNLAKSFIAFHGTKPRGDFTISLDELQINIYGEYNLPLYLSGQDINGSPRIIASRRIIYFPENNEKEAESTNPKLFKILKEKVYKKRQETGIKKLQDYWWKFEYPAQELYDYINEKNFEDVFVACRVSNKFALVRVPANQVFADGSVVFIFKSMSDFAILQSSIYQTWVRKYCATFKEDIRFNIKEVVINFPKCDEKNKYLCNVGQIYHEQRGQIMCTRQEGLTTTYNRFHDPKETAPDIQKLRELHVEMDEAVAAAYSWSDLKLQHGFHDTQQGLRYTISEAARREVLDRLLRLNHERYAEEVRQGLHDKKGVKGKVQQDEAGDEGEFSLAAENGGTKKRGRKGHA